MLDLEMEGVRKQRICRQPQQTGGTTTKEMDFPLEAAGRIWPRQCLDFGPNTHFRPLASPHRKETKV